MHKLTAYLTVYDILLSCYRVLEMPQKPHRNGHFSGSQMTAVGFQGRATSSPQPGVLRSHELDHIRRTRGSVMVSSSQEYIAALGLKKEIPIDSTNTTGTARPCRR